MSLSQISLQEVSFHPTSFCDRDGRVFFWQGELYRGIAPRYVPLCQTLFDTGVVQDLVEKGFLVDTELTDLSLPGYPLVLKHRRIPFVSYVNEWCPEMLRDVAQFTLDMMRELANYGLTLDVGTWDVLYEGSRPLYVDFCSIAQADTYSHYSWNGVQDDFRSYFIHPLLLMNKGCGNLTRWLLADYEHRVIHAELATLMGQRIYGAREKPPKNLSSNPFLRLTHQLSNIVHRWHERWQKVRSRGIARRDSCRLDLLRQMERELAQISLPVTINALPSLSDEWSPKQISIHQILLTLGPATVLDVGCGAGWYAQLAASLGAQVVAIDRDDRQVARCYHTAKTEQLSILPLVMDIRYPSPGQGTGNQLLTPALQRLPCELVLALDLLHLLVFEQHLTLPQAVDALATFSTRWLLVEFSKNTDHPVTDFSETRVDYSLDSLIDLLKLRFQQVSIVSSDDAIAPLILCQK